MNIAPRPTTLTYDNRTYRVGDRVRIPDADYEGVITSVWPCYAPRDDRVSVYADGDTYGRLVHPSRIEHVE